MYAFPSDIAFTPSVKAAQQQRSSREVYAKVEQRGGWQKEVTPELKELIAQRDSFYLGTASADGQPYIQHRGGPKGFLKVLDGNTLAFADFVGNAQYISVGNLDENNKAFIFLMDYANRRRIKVWGTAEYVEDDQQLLARLYDDEYGGRVERAIVFHVHAWDVNCPQHIKPRFVEEDLAPMVEKYQRRISELEAEVQRLRQSHDSR
ncbi:pyridoxamine 5'-phosphate oxidase family protein [Pirellulales bacterium]|nr:pyridoxamine 5'-phosphate oxidase family protein [Pirellulales bacterium]